MAAEHPKVKITHITTVPVSLWGFFPGQISFMQSSGFEISAISSPGEYLQRFAAREHVHVQAVEMHRRITPHRDLAAIVRMWIALRRIKPTVVHSHTPKGGLIGMIAARLAGVPLRIYHIHGLPMVTATGYRRALLRWSDKVACLLADRVLCVSQSVTDIAIEEGLCAPMKIGVLLGGSVNGIDASNRFTPCAHDSTTRCSVRAQLQVPINATVLGFVGRVVRDKGIVELADAWRTLREQYPSLYFLIVGPIESQDPVSPEVLQFLKNDVRVRFAGVTDDMPAMYAAMDIVTLPSYREGLPYVPLEAASMRLPVVATRIPGCIDAVADGVTGTLVPSHDANALANAIAEYVRDPERRKQHGEAGRERVLREFRQEAIWEATYQEYIRLLRERGLPVPSPTEIANSLGTSEAMQP